jgi:hypothetical protein
LRVQAGRDPRERALSGLIGELSTRSEAFSIRWARQNVRLHRTARKRLHNRIVGEIELTGDALELVGDDLTLIAYTADAGSPAEDQLKLLAAWSATRVATADRSEATLPAAGTTENAATHQIPTSTPEIDSATTERNELTQCPMSQL